jgi:hypothetical protein
LAGGALAFSVAIFTGVIAFGTTGREAWWPALLLFVAYPAFITGLVLLARLGGRSDAGVTVDALLVALAAYLVVFAAVIRPNLGRGVDAFISITSPLGAFLTLAMIVRVIFAGGARSWPVRLVLVALGARSAATLAIVVPVIAAEGFRKAYEANGDIPPFVRGLNPLDSPVLLFWVVYGVAIGAAGLLPSLAQTHRVDQIERAPIPTRRMVLVAAAGAAMIVGWLAVVDRAPRDLYSDTGFTIPVALSALVIVLLVLRLALVARHARRQHDVMQREIDHRAAHDPLTGLPNRAGLVARMELVMNRRPAPHTLAVIDLDSLRM